MQRYLASCQDHVKQFRKLIKNAPTVRITGIEPGTTDIQERKSSIPSGVVKILKKPLPKKWVHSIFLRLQTKNGCKAYMSGDCNPETAFDTGWNAGKNVDWSK